MTDEDTTPTADDFYALLNGDPEAALRNVTARREIHWTTAHPGLNPDVDFVDCASCGVLDRQESRARNKVSAIAHADRRAQERNQ